MSMINNFSVIKTINSAIFHFSCIALLCLASCFTYAQDDFSGEALSQYPVNSWPTHGGDIFNRQYSPLTEINKDNVAELKGVWHTSLSGSGVGPQYSGEATPIVYEGVAYVITGSNDVFALDIETGAINWSYQANLNPLITTVCCGWTSRGVGIGEGKIFIGQLDGKIKALDKDSGDVIWEVEAEQWEEGYTFTGAPLYYNGLVITGVSGGERGIRGRVRAFDADDGSSVWTFNTIPGPGEFGHETWPQDNSAWMDGGAPVWQTPAVDPATGLLYFSTGNAGPDFNGSRREGDNLFTASILALDAMTGDYRWHFQEVHHDIWDYDAPNPVILFDIELDGVERKGLVQAGKTGWLYILDRITGEPLIGIEERPVPQDERQKTAATQPFPVGDSFVPQSLRIPPEGYPLINQGKIFTPFWTEQGVIISPGVAGGANWPASAYDPVSQRMFICASDKPFVFKAEEISNERPEPGSNYTGGAFGGEPLPNMGVISAMDLSTNTLVWQYYWNEPCFSGITATASGLLFVGKNDGRLTALDAETGFQLWEFQTGSGMNAPVSIFEYEGSQYVLAYAAGNALAPAPQGDSVWLFSLQGALEETTPPGLTLSSAAGEDDAIDVAEGEPDIENGATIFASACSACHGDEGLGGHGGGMSLIDADNFEENILVISRGRNNMPPLGAVFTPEQLRDVAGFVAQSIAQ